MDGGNHASFSDKKKISSLTDNVTDHIDETVMRQLDAFADVLVNLVLNESYSNDNEFLSKKSGTA